MPDVTDPEIYLAGVVAILDEYPEAVRSALADPRTGTKLLPRYPHLHDIRDACDAAYAPIEREIGRDRASESHSELLLSAPTKPDQARRDEQFIDYEKRIKPLLTAGVRKIEAAPVVKPSDGKHYSRIARDLEIRKARNDQAAASTDPPS